MADSSGNGHGTTKILYFLLSGLSTLLLALAVYGLGVIADHARTIREIAIEHAVLRAEMTEVKAVLTLDRVAHSDRNKELSVLNEKLLLLEQRMMAVGGRLDVHSKRLLSLASRLDGAPVPQSGPSSYGDNE